MALEGPLWLIHRCSPQHHHKRHKEGLEALVVLEVPLVPLVLGGQLVQSGLVCQAVQDRLEIPFVLLLKSLNPRSLPSVL